MNSLILAVLLAATIAVEAAGPKSMFQPFLADCAEGVKGAAQTVKDMMTKLQVPDISKMMDVMKRDCVAECVLKRGNAIAKNGDIIAKKVKAMALPTNPDMKKIEDCAGSSDGKNSCDKVRNFAGCLIP